MKGCLVFPYDKVHLVLSQNYYFLINSLHSTQEKSTKACVQLLFALTNKDITPHSDKTDPAQYACRGDSK